MLTLYEDGTTYLIAVPGPTGTVTVTSLAWGKGTVHVGYRVAGDHPGEAGVAVLDVEGAADQAPQVVQKPEQEGRWLPAVHNFHRLPPAPLPDRGAAITAAVHDLVCPGRVIVSGFAMVNEDVVWVRVRDADGTLLGEVQTEAGGGRANWGSFVITVPLEQQPDGETGSAEVLDLGLDWRLSDSMPLTFHPHREPDRTVEPAPGGAWEPAAEELTVMGVPLRARLEELEAALGKGYTLDGRNYRFGNNALGAHFPYQADLGSRAHRLVTTREGIGAGVKVGQCAGEVAARLGAPQAIAADGAEWQYLSPASNAALTVRFGAGGLVTALELSSYYPAPDEDAPPPPPLDEATARDLLRRYWQADGYERAEWLTTGRAAAHYREWVASNPSGAKAEDWFPDDIRLTVEQTGDGALVRMDYVSNFTGRDTTMTWRFVPIGGTWRIAAWQQAGRWFP